MPDLDIVTAFTCASNQRWEYEVGEYTVRFEHRPPEHNVQYDYTCTCKAFQFGKGKYCRHIKEVQGFRCGWNAELEPTANPDREGTKLVCPNCGTPAIPVRVGV